MNPELIPVYVLLFVFGCAGLTFFVLGAVFLVHTNRHPSEIPQVQRLKKVRSLLGMFLGLALLVVVIVTAVLLTLSQ